MEPLTPRQVQVLKNVIEEYIETAIPVGSDALDRKYSLGVSPATIRNEMMALTNLGYLKQPHTSAGRIPTPKSFKFYVDQLMQEKQMTVAEEVSAKQRVHDSRENFDKLMQESTRALAQATKSLAVAVTDDDEVWHSGYANILQSPEFYNIDVTCNVLSLLEEARKMRQLIMEQFVYDGPIGMVFGEELGWANFEPVGIIACQFTTPTKHGSFAIIGPTRLNYPVIVPVLKYYSSLISES